GRQRERVRLELGAVEEQRAFALRVDAEDLALVAGADEQRAVRRGDHRPQERRRSLVDLLGDRTERQLSVGVDREVLDVALEELTLRRCLEELRRGGLEW